MELSNDGSFVACLYESDVSFVDVEDGVLSRRLRKEGNPGGEEEIVRRARPTTHCLLQHSFYFCASSSSSTAVSYCSSTNISIAVDKTTMNNN